MALRRQKGRLRRAAIFQEPLKGGILKREHGGPGLVDTGRVFAAGLVRQGCLADMIHYVSGSDLLFDIDHRPDLGHSLVDVRIGMVAILLPRILWIYMHPSMIIPFSKNPRTLINFNLSP